MKTLIFCAALAMGVSVRAQAPAVQWATTWGGSNADIASSAIQLADGNYLVLGTTSSTDGDCAGNHGQNDNLLVKLDPAGAVLWKKLYGGSMSEIEGALCPTSDGGCAFTSFSHSTDGDLTGNTSLLLRVWVVKLSPTGAIQWQKTIGGNNAGSIAADIRQTSDGGFVVLAWTPATDGDITANHGGYDIWLAKLDAAGTLQWQRSYGGSLDEYASAVRQTTDGGYIVAGSSPSSDGDLTSNRGGRDGWALKLDVSGNIQWQKNYGGTLEDFFESVTQTADGGFVFGGASRSANYDVPANKGSYDAWILKTDAAGAAQWSQSLGGPGSDQATTVLQTSDGGFVGCSNPVAGGGDVGSPLGQPDFWLFKLDATGSLLWEKSYGGSDLEEHKRTILTNDGGFLIVGSSKSTDHDIVDASRGNSDAVAMKLGFQGSVGVHESAMAAPFQLFPNPATDQVSIRHPGLKEGSTFVLTDLTGRALGTQLSDAEITRLSLAGLSPGVYLLTVIGTTTPALKIVKH